LKSERWGSPLVREMCQVEKAFDKTHAYSIIIIIIIIIIRRDTYFGEEKFVPGYGGDTRIIKHTSKNCVLCGSIILKLVLTE